jgi:acetyl-CoA carboxylase carboxyl transferase subunit alpha
VAGRRFVMEFERPLAELEDKLEELKRLHVVEQDPELGAEIDELEVEIAKLRETLYLSLTPWEKVQVARHPDRPRGQDYVRNLFDDVFVLRGDRHFGDDEAMLAALATLGGRRCVVLAHRKGRDFKENLTRNFGQPHPEGFRKARRAMCLAEKAGLPVVSFVDTQGAYPGIEAEERGQGWAIAENLATLSSLRVPVVVVGVGEGGSGGALAIGFGDRLLMLQNASYSVISPEGCATILHKDASKACEVAASMQMTADDLVRLGIADEILPEPIGGAHRDPQAVYGVVGEAVGRTLDELRDIPADELVTARYERLRGIGVFVENNC